MAKKNQVAETPSPDFNVTTHRSISSEQFEKLTDGTDPDILNQAYENCGIAWEIAVGELDFATAEKLMAEVEKLETRATAEAEGGYPEPGVDAAIPGVDYPAPELAKGETSKEYLRCRLSAEERDEIGSKMAEAQMRITELKEAKKAVVAQYASDIAAEEEAMNSLARRLFNGFEMRTLECLVIRDYEAKKITIVRPDDGEIVKQRAMTVEELQRALPLQEPGQAEPAE